ncbi:tyrosine-type recombinase/integrase [Candidatus Riflebacteria bacterium]
MRQNDKNCLTRGHNLLNFKHGEAEMDNNATPENNNVTSILQTKERALIRLLKGLNYEQTAYLMKRARKALGLKSDPKKPEKLPEILTDEEFSKLIDTASRKNATHASIIKFLSVTGLRVSELCNIKIQDVNWEACKIHIHQGKGRKDRIVLYPISMKQEIRLQMATKYRSLKDGSMPLFMSQKGNAFSRQTIHRFIQKYASESGISKKVYPHLLRHGHLTELAAAGIGDTAIQAQSGHKNKAMLEIYTHLAGINRELFEKAVNKQI